MTCLNAFVGLGTPKWLTGSSLSSHQQPLATCCTKKPISVYTTRAVAAPARKQVAVQGAEDFDDVVMKTYGRYPIAMAKGKGAILWDTDGKEYIDCVAGIATCTLGHADERLAKAVGDQMRKLCHVSNLYYIPEQGRLARWLVEHSPADKVFFCNSGAEANEAAFKLARKNWWRKRGSKSGGSPVIISAHKSFHGRTLATITATGQPKYHKDFGPMVAGFQYATYNDVEDLKRVAADIGDNLAGIILEAMQGEGGVVPGTADYFAAARDICDNTGALLICDEVQVGMGRTGKLWGFENLGVNPDVVTTAKGLGGGVPIGAMLCKEAFNVFGPGDHASTFGGNPLATVAGFTVCTALESEGVMANCAARGEQVRSGLKDIARKISGVIKEIRGWGLINGVELSDNGDLTAGKVVQAAMEEGLLLVPAGPKVVRFVPPLVITEEQVKEALAKFESAVAKVAKAVPVK